jgi:RNA polymerase sigma factor (TIGR02999 family)
MSDVTRLLEAARKGDGSAKDALLTLVYEELRRIAHAKMAHEQSGHTLQPTALVHEVWLRVGNDLNFQNRAHFFSAAAEAMRRILIDSARRKKRIKHGGAAERINVEDVDLALPLPVDQFLALDEALNRLATIDDRAAEMVKLCFFVGLTQEEAAKELGVSISTAERLWSFARAWLFKEIKNSEGPVS